MRFFFRLMLFFKPRANAFHVYFMTRLTWLFFSCFLIYILLTFVDIWSTFYKICQNNHKRIIFWFSLWKLIPIRFLFKNISSLFLSIFLYIHKYKYCSFYEVFLSIAWNITIYIVQKYWKKLWTLKYLYQG